MNILAMIGKRGVRMRMIQPIAAALLQIVKRVSGFKVSSELQVMIAC